MIGPGHKDDGGHDDHDDDYDDDLQVVLNMKFENMPDGADRHVPAVHGWEARGLPWWRAQTTRCV
jgi:hypothetical protein